ncbi:site-specific DNA-methyltransferase [Qipengyuania flava]|nr:site-specific DNA-methyltransferase [Qipengyuania flava]
MPFQRWFRFKEAFSPKFVADTINDLPGRIESCLDPFGGSGTSALTCRMLGLSSCSIEVNPFLADLIEAKVTPLPGSEVARDYDQIIRNLVVTEADYRVALGMPKTFVQSDGADRYVFEADVFAHARAINRSIETLPSDTRRILRVLLGSTLVPNSNVLINGKGRRYRRNWQERRRTSDDLLNSLDRAVDAAVDDLARYSVPPSGDTHSVLRGDARQMLKKVSRADVAILSPPYPNSFDYTDVYNLELWMLGYLNSVEDNRALRGRTLRSHVQIKWSDELQERRSDAVMDTVRQLQSIRGKLWNRNIPEMIAYYFDDLHSIFREFKRILGIGQHAVVAIGDSRYGGKLIDVATLLAAEVKPLGFELRDGRAIRSMRASSQHGGSLSLREHCLVFERTA